MPHLAWHPVARSDADQHEVRDDAGRSWGVTIRPYQTSDRRAVALILGVGGGLLVAILGCVDFVRREESASPQLTRPAGVVLTSLLVGFVTLAGLSRSRVARALAYADATRFITVESNT